MKENQRINKSRKAVLKSVALLLAVSIFTINSFALPAHVLLVEDNGPSSYVDMVFMNHSYSVDDYQTFYDKFVDIQSFVYTLGIKYMPLVGGVLGDYIIDPMFDWKKDDPIGSVSLTGYNKKQITGVFYPDGTNYVSTAKYSLKVEKTGIYSFKNYTISTSKYYVDDFLTNGIRITDINGVTITESNNIGEDINDVAITEFEYHLYENTQYYIEFSAYYLYMKFKLLDELNINAYGKHYDKYKENAYSVNYQSNIRVTPVSFDDESEIDEPIEYVKPSDNPLDDNSPWVLDHIDSEGKLYYRHNAYIYAKEAIRIGRTTDYIGTYDNTLSKTIINGDILTFTNNSNINTAIKNNNSYITYYSDTTSITGSQFYIKLSDFTVPILGTYNIEFNVTGNVEIVEMNNFTNNSSLYIYKESSYDYKELSTGIIEINEKYNYYSKGSMHQEGEVLSLSNENYLIISRYYMFSIANLNITPYVVVEPFTPISQTQVNNYENNYTFITNNEYNTQNIFNTENKTVTVDLSKDITMNYTDITYDYTTNSVYFYNSETNEYSSIVYTDNSTTIYYQKDELLNINNYYYNNYNYGDYIVNSNNTIINNGSGDGTSGGTTINNNEAETNIWDFLGDAITPILDFLSGTIDKTIEVGKSLFGGINDLFGDVFGNISIQDIFINRYIKHLYGSSDITVQTEIITDTGG